MYSDSLEIRLQARAKAAEAYGCIACNVMIEVHGVCCAVLSSTLALMHAHAVRHVSMAGTDSIGWQ